MSCILMLVPLKMHMLLDHKHLHSHNHTHIGAHATAHNHHKHSNIIEHNPVISVTTEKRGYNNDVRKYIKERKIKTLSSMTKDKSNTASRLQHSVDETTTLPSTTITSKATKITSFPHQNIAYNYNTINEEESYYNPFSGYEDDCYYGGGW